MQKQAIIIGLSLACMFTSLLHLQLPRVEYASIVVPDDFPTIQEGINKAVPGDTIYLKAGVYHEEILVNKSISLIGEDRYNTVVDGSGSGTVIQIRVSDVSVANLTVRNTGSSIEDSAIRLSGVENCSINGNVLIKDVNDGIMLVQSIRNTLTANIVEETRQSGIILIDSNNNTVLENTVQNSSSYGIVLQNSSFCNVSENIVTQSRYEGIALLSSNGNSVSRNRVTNSTSHGIRLDDPSDYNTITENTVTDNNGYGLWMWYSSHNLFYHNQCNNTRNVLILSAPEQGYNATNLWDNGYASGGNYWSDYGDQDLYSGSYQNQTGGDGIGDAPYVIDKYNADRYPLMHPWSSLPVHNMNTGTGYATIQQAVNANETLDRHRIFVEAGTYNENIVATKAVSLIGEMEETTIIDGMALGTVMELSSNNVTVTGFTLRNSGPGWAQSGIALSHVGNCNVSGNIITNNYYGMWLETSLDNIILGNNFVSDGYGIGLYSYSNRNSLTENNVTGSGHAGILLVSSMENDISGNNVTNNQYSVELVSSSNNTITENDIANNSHGIALYESSNYNDIIGNDVQTNGWGVETDTSVGNRIFHNNFIDNIPQVYFYDSGYANLWDSGYPEGGNYWSDYNGTDFHTGFYQNETGIDAIGDTSYSIDNGNEDHYPLMGIFHDFVVLLPPNLARGIEHVNVISNSTLSSLYYLTWLNTPNQYLQPGQLLIQFSTIEENDAGGFCRIMIPRTVLNTSAYIVLVDWKPVNVVELPTSNSTDVYLYFTYTCSKNEIIVTIPEFPSMIPSLTLIAATLLSVMIFRRKHIDYVHENRI